MRRLKIMSDDVPMACGDEFGVNELQDRLKAFCREHGWEMPRFWIFPPKGYYVCHCFSMHLKGKGNWKDVEASVVFMLMDFSTMDNREIEANHLSSMLKDLGEPVVLTSKVAEMHNHQQRFFESVGLVKMPVRWEDDAQNEYEVYVYGKIPRKSIAIPTITNDSYSPDFMYVVKKKDGTKELNIIVETKGVDTPANLRGVEEKKISCAKQFFDQLREDNPELNVSFHDQLNNQQIRNIIEDVIREAEMAQKDYC